MTRPHQHFAGATTDKSHGRAIQPQASYWSARGVGKRAVPEPLRQPNVEATTSLCTLCQTLRNGA
eukprot:5551692-Lingulodinium_polyedra.AAC.1